MSPVTFDYLLPFISDLTSHKLCFPGIYKKNSMSSTRSAFNFLEKFWRRRRCSLKTCSIIPRFSLYPARYANVFLNAPYESFNCTMFTKKPTATTSFSAWESFWLIHLTEGLSTSIFWKNWSVSTNQSENVTKRLRTAGKTLKRFHWIWFVEQWNLTNLEARAFIWHASKMK